MIKTRRSFFPVVLVFLLLFAWVGVAYGPAQQVGEQAVKETSQEEQEPEKIVGTPQDAKQETGIWVFIIWVWISVLVLIYFLRLKIKEADRLYRLRFYSAKKN
jgi:Na+/H+ antiporter NhaC